VALLDELANVALATLVSWMTFAAWLFVFDYDHFSRLLLLYFGTLNLIILLNFHLLVRLLLRSIRTRGHNLKNVLLVGAGRLGTEVAETLVGHPWTGFDVIGFLDDAPEKVGKMWAGLAPVLGDLGQAGQIVAQQDVDEVIIALPATAHHRLVDVVQALQDQPVNIYVIPDLVAVATIRPQVEDLWGIPVIGIRQPVISGLDAALKRAMDVVGSLVGLVILAPVMLITAILIKLDSKGPIFFAQERVGENGRTFHVVKFRTMVENAEELLEKYVRIEDLDEPVFKLKNDPRVTKVGRFLRRTSIDELPQLINILKGEMSLVGPRPEEVKMVKRYNSHQRKRLAVKPGLTGPMQVNGRGDLSLEARVRLELDYIRNYTLWKDVEIIVKTIPVVLRGDGSY
jgi:exopolysaccharide biosynthesis polyprenyl glycosylphosphotransferase